MLFNILLEDLLELVKPDVVHEIRLSFLELSLHCIEIFPPDASLDGMGTVEGVQRDEFSFLFLQNITGAANQVSKHTELLFHVFKLFKQLLGLPLDNLYNVPVSLGNCFAQLCFHDYNCFSLENFEGLVHHFDLFLVGASYFFDDFGRRILAL